MDRAAQSLVVFAAYMLALGAALLIAPNPFLRGFGFTATQEPWIRLLGVLVLCLAYYYMVAARQALTGFAVATVHTRLFVAACIMGLVFFGIGPPPLLVFAAIDMAGAAWTWRALRDRG